MNERFAGRTAVVTGAGSGLGRAVARRLAEEGARVACVDLSAGAAEETAGAIGAAAAAFPADVTDAGAMRSTVDAAARALGRPSIVVTCAGIGKFAHAHEMTPEDWNRIIAVNLTGTFLAIQATLPHLMDGGGTAVLIASNAGLMGQPYSAAYCASKGGVVQLTRALADEYIDRKVRVNCVAPGGMDTPLIEQFKQAPAGMEWQRLAKCRSPYGNATPEEVAGVVAFVASDEARYMTGAIVPVDGGLTL